ncbi:hypothetical protein ACF1BN_28925 [Streptomyces sp. NPDC014861]|uniref:hypothetical protein n=1 Tax=Streptomyces sp. NPDC014861 TaxID=3364923 RepID=UPI0036FB4621
MTRQRVEMRHRQPTDTDEPEIRAPEPGGEAPETGPEKKRKVDLSVPQVAGSALAAVIAAKLASTLGVYGTILGAGVISVIATCGGPLFQLLFSRTGEQVRDATAAKPRARQVPSTSPDPSARQAPPAGDRHTLMLGTVTGPAAPFPYDEDFGTATTHGTRLRGWRRPMLAAALVFGVTMGGITTYELVSGEDFSGTKGTTTFGSVVRGGGDGGGQDAPEERRRQERDQQQDQERGQEPRTPAPTGSAGQDAEEGGGTDAGTPSTGTTPDPGTGTPGGDPATGPTPDPSGSADGGTTPTQEPVEPVGPTEPTTGPTAPVTPPAPTETPATGQAPQDAPTAPSGAGAG